MHGLWINFVASVTLIVATGAGSAAFGQTPGNSASNAGQGSAASHPDFSGAWSHPYLPGFEPPVSGPGPITNRARLRNGVSDWNKLVGDFTNPILKPESAEVVKKHGDLSLAGVVYPTPGNQCWPQPTPYIFWNIGMLMLQQPGEVTIIYDKGHEIRHVRMNASHPATVTPSWYGDSVGHYEGDTLVIDTIGVKTARPFAMIDNYGTPYTKALHVVERYRLLSATETAEAIKPGEKENLKIPVNDSGLGVDLNAEGLLLQFTVEDEGAFTMPWAANITYRRAVGEWPEFICVENLHEYYYNKNSEAPTADKPDF